MPLEGRTKGFLLNVGVSHTNALLNAMLLLALAVFEA